MLATSGSISYWLPKKMNMFLWRCLVVILYITMTMSEDLETTMVGGLHTREALTLEGRSTQGTTESQRLSGFVLDSTLPDVTNNNIGTPYVTTPEIQTFNSGIVFNKTTHFASQPPSTSTDRGNISTDVSGANQVSNESEILDSTDSTSDDIHFFLPDDSSGVPFICHYILTPIIAIPGFICNVFNIFVLTKQGFEDSTTSYLVALSVADLLFLAVNLVTWSFSLLKMFMYPVYVKCLLAMRFNFISRGLQITFGRVSNLFVLVLSTERFIAVKFPFRVKLSPFVRHPAKISASVFVFTFLFILPSWFTEEYQPGVDPRTNITQAIRVRSDFYKNNYDAFRVYSAFMLFVFRFLPVFLVLFFNLGIAVVLNLSEKNATKMNVVDSKRHQQQLKITRMVISIATIFLVCVTPTIIHTLVTLNFPKYFTENLNIWVIVQSLALFLDIVNSAVNFLVYIVLSEKFRSIFLQYVFRRKPRTGKQSNARETAPKTNDFDTPSDPQRAGEPPDEHLELTF